MKLDLFESFQPEGAVVLGDRYCLVKKLSENGPEQTFQAKDLNAPGHPACIVRQFKVPADCVLELPTVRKLFRADVKGLARLKDCECVPNLLAHFESQNNFYLVLENIEGHPLAEELSSPIPWSDRQVVALLNDLLSTLECIHHNRVLHLNLQPSTLIRDRESNRLVLTGFGALQQAISRQLSSMPPIGTLPASSTSLYMPDEQIAGQPQPNSDIYAAGAIAIQALTGHPLEDIPTQPQTRELYWHSLASLRHPDLLALLDNLIARNYRKRYQTASEALNDLSALPPEITWSSPSEDAQDTPQAAIQNAIRQQQLPRKPAYRRFALPIGSALLALVGLCALFIWRYPRTTTIAARNTPTNRPSQGPTLQSPTPPAEVEPDEGSASPAEAASPETSAARDGSARIERPIEEGSLQPAIEEAAPPVATDPSVDSSLENNREAIALAPEAAKATVDRFYEFVSTRSWEAARSLLSADMSQKLEPNFFYQFQDVSVENMRVVSQTPELADLMVQNTYIYLDGSYQQEERSYTVQMVDNQPTIVDTAFIEVIRDRGYGE